MTNNRQAWLRNLISAWHSLDEADERQMPRAHQARILLTGLRGAGKSTLYNWLQEVEVSPVGQVDEEKEGEGYPLEQEQEDLGLFTLMDLPTGQEVVQPSPPSWGMEASPIVPGWDVPAYDGMANPYMGGWPTSFGSSVPEAELILFVVDSQTGFDSDTFRWFRRLHARGTPLIVVFNKIDLISGDISAKQMARELARRLAVPVVPISASEGSNILERLLPKMVELCPSLLVPLGRELAIFRRRAAQRVVNQTAGMCGLVGLEPVPVLDVPFQLALEIRMVMQLASLYGRSFGSGVKYRTEVILMLLVGLLLRYMAQQVIKWTPFVGWLLSGILSAIGIWLVGFVMIRYIEWLQKDEPIGEQVGHLRQKVQEQQARSAAHLREQAEKGQNQLGAWQNQLGERANQLGEQAKKGQNQLGTWQNQLGERAKRSKNELGERASQLRKKVPRPPSLGSRFRRQTTSSEEDAVTIDDTIITEERNSP